MPPPPAPQWFAWARPIVIFSSLGDEELGKLATQVGADGFLSKANGLEALGEVPRACLLLSTLRELSYGEIAALLTIPEGTAMSHVHRARLVLRERLAPRGCTPSADATTRGNGPRGLQP